MLRQSTDIGPSFESLESFLSYFRENVFDVNSSFKSESSNVQNLHNFLLNYSAPNEPDSLPFLKAALILLLLHPNVMRQSPGLLTKIRSILLQIIGRCVRRASRAQIKTLPITVPLLLPHFTDPNLLSIIIRDLHLDLIDRIKKSKGRDQFYNDPLTANLLIVFDHLYLVNESFHSIGYSGRIDPSEFYHKFPADFEVHEDYAHWRDLTEISDRNLPFAFCDYPWIFDLDLKRNLLLASNGLKQRHHLQDAFFRAIFDGVQSTNLQLSIRRDHLIQDARDQLLGKPGYQLAKQLRITFVGEEGIDEGGLKKEFFQLCWNEIFNGLGQSDFKEIDNSLFWFNDTGNGFNEQFTFVGILLALAIYNNVLVAPRFPLLLFKKLLNWPLQLEDYAEIDPIMVKSLNQLTVECIDGLYHVVPGNEGYQLIPNGSKIPVDRSNVYNYIQLLTSYLLNDSVSLQFEAFRSGFELISSGSVIYGYRPDELFSLAYGSDQFSISDLREVAKYDGGYFAGSPQIKWLWNLIENELTSREQCEFLFFVTGSSRAPLGGLRQLSSFTITRVPGDSDRLPSAHTCFNCLLLPEYSTPLKLEQKLRVAIEHNRGFGLI